MLAMRLLSEGVEGPSTELAWILYLGLGLFLLAIIFGWWSASRKQDPVMVEVEAVSSTPKAKSADDLVKIEGIGPKVAKVLNKAGITTFDDLAQADANEVQSVLDQAGLQMMNPEGWIAQAKLAAKGDWEKFEALQKKLVGGRKKKK